MCFEHHIKVGCDDMELWKLLEMLKDIIYELR